MSQIFVLAFVSDLFVQARLSQVAHDHGVTLRSASSLFRFLPELGHQPAAVLLDVGAQGISPVTLISQVRSHSPGVPIAVLADGDEPEFAQVEAAGIRILPRNEGESAWAGWMDSLA